MSYKEMLLRMRERGLDLRLPHTFDLYVCLPPKKATHTVTKFACRLGFTVEVIAGAKRGTWFCIATKTLAPPWHSLLGYWRDRLVIIACAGKLFNHFAREQG